MLILQLLRWSLRTVLCVCAIMWIVGQSYPLSIILPVSGGMVGAELAADGWRCRRITMRFAVSPADCIRTRNTVRPSTLDAHENFLLIALMEDIMDQDTSDDPVDSYFSMTIYASPSPSENEQADTDYRLVPHWVLIAMTAVAYAIVTAVVRRRLRAAA